jgi:CheY-like chemotaxis protein
MSCRNLRVLVVEGDPLLRATYGRLLKGLRVYDHQEVESGAEALGAAVYFRPDVVIVNLALSAEMGGQEVLERLRGSPLFDRTAIVAATPMVRWMRRAPCITTFDDVLATPLSGQALVGLLEREAGRRRVLGEALAI